MFQPLELVSSYCCAAALHCSPHPQGEEQSISTLKLYLSFQISDLTELLFLNSCFWFVRAKTKKVLHTDR